MTKNQILLLLIMFLVQAAFSGWLLFLRGSERARKHRSEVGGLIRDKGWKA